MMKKWLFVGVLMLSVAVIVAACGGTSGASAPSKSVTSTVAPIATPTGQGMFSTNASNSDASPGYASQTVEGGNVTVTVTPLALKPGAPLEFDIAMNTHSVDLSYDMLKAVALRDDQGREYTPTAWDGPGAGGHHREGKIKFAPLSSNSKGLVLLVKNVAGVAERVYRWELAQ